MVLKGAVEELGQNGKTSETRTQKSRFGYKWDFGTRLVNIGIWQGVYIEYIENARVLERRDEETIASDVNLVVAGVKRCDDKFASRVGKREELTATRFAFLGFELFFFFFFDLATRSTFADNEADCRG